MTTPRKTPAPKKPSVFAYVMQQPWKPFRSVVSIGEFADMTMSMPQLLEAFKDVAAASTHIIARAMERDKSDGGEDAPDDNRD